MDPTGFSAKKTQPRHAAVARPPTDRVFATVALLLQSRAQVAAGRLDIVEHQIYIVKVIQYIR